MDEKTSQEMLKKINKSRTLHPTKETAQSAATQRAEEASSEASSKRQELFQKMDKAFGCKSVSFLLPEEIFERLLALDEQNIEVNDFVVEAIESALKAAEKVLSKVAA